jgi:hypothetical protein
MQARRYPIILKSGTLTSLRFLLLCSNRMLVDDTSYLISFISGPPSHCILSLLSYGIPGEYIPWTETGEMKKKQHADYIKYRRQLDEYDRKGVLSEYIEFPLNQDVLFGKGKPLMKHVGNLRLQWLVEESLEQYNSQTEKQQKSDIIAQTFQKVRDSNGRFLSKESGVWIPVPDHLALSKISHLFRNRRNIQRRKQEYTSHHVSSSNSITSRAKADRPTSSGGSSGCKRLKVEAP